MATLREIVRGVLGGGPTKITPDQIRVSMLGALGEVAAVIEAGGEIDLVWVASKRGAGCRLVVRHQKTTITKFAAEGEARRTAATAVWLMAKSAAAHSEGTPWAAAGARLADAVDGLMRKEGLL